MSRLIDADALINDILTDYGCDPKYIADETIDGLKPYTDQLILERIGLQPTIAASPWHRVEEPPKEYGNYLAVVNGEVMEVTYSDMRDDWKWSTCDADGFTWIRSELVTHWMPLPEPPKEDA